MAAILDQRFEKAYPVDKLVPHPDNPNKGNVGVIEDSIDHNGFYGAILAQASSGRILAGHHRLQAAKKQGLERVPVMLIDCDDDTARRILLVDNRSAELATRDHAKLDEILREILDDGGDLAGTGYEPEFLHVSDTPDLDPPKVEREFSEELFEEHQYVVLVFRNSVDWQAARETLGIRSVKGRDWKPNYQREGIGRVIDGAEIVRRINGGE